VNSECVGLYNKCGNMHGAKLKNKEGRSVLTRCVNARDVGQEAAARFQPRATKTKPSLLRSVNI
jgi:hypothetical protein